MLLLQQWKSSCRVVKMPESKPKPEQVQLLKDWKRAMNLYIYIHIDPHVIQKKYIYTYPLALAHGRSFTKVSCRQSTSTKGLKRSNRKPKERRHIPWFVQLTCYLIYVPLISLQAPVVFSFLDITSKFIDEPQAHSRNVSIIVVF